MDTVAVLGQQTHLSCLMENKRNELGWMRNNFGLGVESIAYADRYSLLKHTNANSSKQTADERSPSPAEAAQSSISNYTLFIKTVSLADDAHFMCIDTVNHLKSRRAKLTVWQPPSRLLLGAKVSAQNDQSSEDYSNDLLTLLELDPSPPSHHHHHHDRATSTTNLAQVSPLPVTRRSIKREINPESIQINLYHQFSNTHTHTRQQYTLQC